MPLFKKALPVFPSTLAYNAFVPFIRCGEILYSETYKNAANAFGSDQKANIIRSFRKQVENYDRQPHNSKKVVQWFVNSIPELDNSMNVLDVGVGTGLVSAALAPKVNKITGVDVSRHMLKAAEAKLGDFSNADISNQDVTELPYDDESFDLVVSRLTLNYASDIEKAINEMVRVCKSNGQIVISEFVVPKQPGSVSEHYNTLERIRDPAHSSFYSVDQLSNLIAQAGVTLAPNNGEIIEVEESLESYFDSAKTLEPNRKVIHYALQGNLNYEDGTHDQITGLKPVRSGDDIFINRTHGIIVGKKI